MRWPSNTSPSRGSDYFKRKGAYIAVVLGGHPKYSQPCKAGQPQSPHRASSWSAWPAPFPPRFKKEAVVPFCLPGWQAHSTDSDRSGHCGEDTVHFPWAANWPTSGPVAGRRGHLASQQKQMNGVLFLTCGSCLSSRRLSTCARVAPRTACRPPASETPGAAGKFRIWVPPT